MKFNTQFKNVKILREVALLVTCEELLGQTTPSGSGGAKTKTASPAPSKLEAAKNIKIR